MKIISETKVLLCKTGSCCPSVVRNDVNGVRGDTYTISDDHGGAVLITVDEMNMLHDAIAHYMGNSQTS